MRPLREYEAAVALAGEGCNASEISRRLGIPRSTVRDWLSAPQRGSRPRFREARPNPFPWLTEHAYAYFLGLYLGDGHIAAMRRDVYMLRIFLDAAYPLIVEEARAAVALVVPSGRSGVHSHRKARMKIVTGFSKDWPCLVPQHGPGRKHLRRIELAGWQRAICDRHPDRLVRGLIHSDGCRSTNTIRHPKRTYSYPRYQFCNCSEEIREIFCGYCDRLGVQWRRMNEITISVARRESVALLDRYVGPKR